MDKVLDPQGEKNMGIRQPKVVDAPMLLLESVELGEAEQVTADTVAKIKALRALRANVINLEAKLPEQD